MKLIITQCERCKKFITVDGSMKRNKCWECRKADSLRVMRCRARKDPLVKIGVGSGGNQWGENNPCYRGGYADYKKIYRMAYPNQDRCELCGSKKFLVIHHRDENRRNGSIDNLQMLCRSCHSKVHGLVNNFTKPK